MPIEKIVSMISHEGRIYIATETALYELVLKDRNIEGSFVRRLIMEFNF